LANIVVRCLRAPQHSVSQELAALWIAEGIDVSFFRPQRASVETSWSIWRMRALAVLLFETVTRSWQPFDDSDSRSWCVEMDCARLGTLGLLETRVAAWQSG
jgi:hypothetical protein